MVNRLDVHTFIYFELASSPIVPVYEFTVILNLTWSRWPLQTEGLPSMQPLGQKSSMDDLSFTSSGVYFWNAYILFVQ